MPTSIIPKPVFYALSAALLIAPATADAQFGGLVKKVTEKAVEKGTEKATEKGTEKATEKVGGRAGDRIRGMKGGPGLGTEFTAEQLDRVLNALELTASAWMKADSIGRLIEPMDKQLADVMTRSGGEINAYVAKKGTWEMCRSDAQRDYQSANQDSQQAMADKLAQKYRTDPAAAQRLTADMARMQQQANTAMAAGDTAGARRLYEDWMKKNGFGSALGMPETELLSKCGSLVAPPASLATRDALQARIDTLRTHQRAAAEVAGEEARAASGLPAEQFYPMNERVERWYAIAVEGKKGEHFWSDQEGALFESRRARIERVFRQLRA